jgi:ankyrin repeat protein
MIKRKKEQTSAEAEDIGDLTYVPVLQDRMVKYKINNVIDKMLQGIQLNEDDYRILNSLEGSNINYISSYGNALIHSAARNGNRELLSYLIERDEIDVIQKNVNNDTPLMLAIKSGDKDSVLLIIQKIKDLCVPIDLFVTNEWGSSLNSLIEANPNGAEINQLIAEHNARFVVQAEVGFIIELGSEYASSSESGYHSDSELGNFRVQRLGAADPDDVGLS